MSDSESDGLGALRVWLRADCEVRYVRMRYGDLGWTAYAIVGERAYSPRAPAKPTAGEALIALSDTLESEAGRLLAAARGDGDE